MCLLKSSSLYLSPIRNSTVAAGQRNGILSPKMPKTFVRLSGDLVALRGADAHQKGKSNQVKCSPGDVVISHIFSRDGRSAACRTGVVPSRDGDRTIGGFTDLSLQYHAVAMHDMYDEHITRRLPKSDARMTMGDSKQRATFSSWWPSLCSAEGALVPLVGLTSAVGLADLSFMSGDEEMRIQMKIKRFVMLNEGRVVHRRSALPGARRNLSQRD
eukprot:PhM_4_TR12653/c0_g1_i1/m.53024